MSDDLYEHDILAWSTRQADLLRRLARGERVNGVDWDHVAEEIEDVGLSELNAVCSYLRQMMVHLLKIARWPDSQSVGHWRGEVAAFQADAAQRFAPSMRRKVNLGKLYARALTQLGAMDKDTGSAPEWPATCPFTLNQLLNDSIAALETSLARVLMHE